MILPNVTHQDTRAVGHIPQKLSLSPETLAELKAARDAKNEAAREGANFDIPHKRFKAVLAIAGRELGVRLERGGANWNRILDAIDAAHPDWRGEVVEICNPALLELAA